MYKLDLYKQRSRKLWGRSCIVPLCFRRFLSETEETMLQGPLKTIIDNALSILSRVNSLPLSKEIQTFPNCEHSQRISEKWFNPLLHDKILDRSKLKACADD